MFKYLNKLSKHRYKLKLPRNNYAPSCFVFEMQWADCWLKRLTSTDGFMISAIGSLGTLWNNITYVLKLAQAMENR